MNIYKFVTFLFIPILLVVFCMPISTAQKEKTETKDTPTQTSTGKEPVKTDESTQFKRDLHPCDSQKGEGFAIKGTLQYNLDCAPWANDKILDLTGKSDWSIVSWFVRLITFAYRVAFVMTIVAIFIAGLKYIKAGGEGGFAVAKDALKFALIGFLVTSTSWSIVAMFSKAMSMVGGGIITNYELRITN
jgi:hypothetical protein